jgi:hypothetical protein
MAFDLVETTEDAQQQQYNPAFSTARPGAGVKAGTGVFLIYKTTRDKP